MTPPVNFLAVLVASLVPLIVGFIWYNSNVFGKAWMASTGMTEEKAKNSNMILIMVLSLVFNVFISFILAGIVTHQMGLFSLLQFGDKAVGEAIFTDVMSKYGDAFRTLGHGAFHGAFAGLLFVTPIVATGAMHEQKGWKYILITAGYWVVNLAIMGSIICAWKPA